MKRVATFTFGMFLMASISGLPLLGQQPVYLDRAAWEAGLGKKHVNNPAFEFVQRDPALPDLLVIGNSISIGYTPTVKGLLEGRANVYRIPENGGDTRKFLESHRNWLQGVDWNLIHINIGLHDLKRLDGHGELNRDFERVNSPEQYRENLEKVFTILQQDADAVIVWATTTVIPEGSSGRIPGDEILYNQVSMDVLKGFPDIFINDLHAYSLGIKSFQREANVHYHPAGYALLGGEVARVIGELLTSGDE